VCPEIEWESTGFGTEEKIVPVMNLCLGVILRGMPTEGNDFPRSGPFNGSEECLVTHMMRDIHFRPVIQTSPFQVFVIHLKTEGVD